MDATTATSVNAGSEATTDSSVQLYAEAFPPLDVSPSAGGNTSATSANGWQFPRNASKIAPIKTSIVTQIVEIPFEERRFKDKPNDFGSTSDQTRVCSLVQNDFDVKIELLNNTRTKSLTLMVTGRIDSASKAVAELRKRLQTQSQSEMVVPTEFHRFIIGKQGAVLREIKQKSGCEIFIPRENDANPEQIRIVGPKENIDKAKHEIQCIYDEVSKKSTERLTIPRIYHPFIAGPHNKQVNQLMEEHGVRINIPPVMAQHDLDIVRISGEKDGVVAATRIVKQIYEDISKRAQTVTIEVSKNLHKFVIGQRGSGLQDILAQTGISVEVPPADDPSETIVLRGEGTKLGTALTKVYEKADSFASMSVLAPQWLHRHLIGPGGESLQKIVQLPKHKAQINFLKTEDKVDIDGPKEEVEVIHRNIKAWVDDYLKKNRMVEVPVPREFHRHVIGKSGATVNKIRETTGCTVRVPGEMDAEDVIRIEGPKDKVESAKQELLQIVNKQANERAKDLIIEHQFHRALIGQSGAKIQEIREKYPDVLIKFPNADQKSDVVQLRGPREQLAGAEKLLKKAHSDLKETSYEEKVRILKNYHKDIIGRKGQTISKIRDETNTRILLPDANLQSDVITVIGRQKDVQKAVKQINEIQRTAANIGEEQVQIASKLHQGLIGHGGKLIRQLQDQHPGVHVHFPSANEDSNTVTVRGPKLEVTKATKALMQLAEERMEDSHEETVQAKPELHRFLIGRQGSNIEQLRKTTGARVIFPSVEDRGKPEADIITVIGKKEAALKAKQLLQERIKDLENLTEETVEVERKWHKSFLERRNYYINQLSEEFGGVQVSFPRDPNSAKVTVKGPKDCVQAAIERIHEIVADLAARITIEVSIPAKHHRGLIGRNGDNVRDICDQFDVNVKFPEAKQRQQQQQQQQQQAAAAAEPAAEPAEANGEANVEANAEANADDEAGAEAAAAASAAAAADIVTISGLPDKCELAKEALLDLVPIEEQMAFPSEFRGGLIGRGGEAIVKLTEELKVNIAIPNAGDCITLTGTPKRVEAARERLQQRLQELEADKADQQARSYEATITVPQQYHRAIIGPKGNSIKALQQRHDVRVNIPNSSEKSDTITVIGYKEKADAAALEIDNIRKKFDSHTSAELFITHHVHPMIIGQRGRNLHSIMEKFSVTINMPGRQATGDAKDSVVVKGAPEDVDAACDHLLEIASEVIDRLIDRGDLDPRALRQQQEQQEANAKLNGDTNNSNATNGNNDDDQVDNNNDDENNSEANNNNNNNSNNANGNSAGGKGKRRQQQQQQQKRNNNNNKSATGFQVRDAPWHQQLGSAEHFPAMPNNTTTPSNNNNNSSNNNNNNNSATGAWARV